MTDGDTVQLVVFRVGPQHFAIDIFQVERILRYAEPAPLPKAPDFLEGMLAYGEGLVPLVDLRTRLDAEARIEEDTRIMILSLEPERIGIVVDAVLEVAKVPATEITPPHTLIRGLAAEFINGVVRHQGRTVVLLSPGRLLSSTERVALEQLMVEVGDE